MPRVVHEDVQPPEVALGGADGLLPVGLTRDVEMHEDGLAALRVDLRLDTPALGFEHVTDDDLGAFPREQPRLGRRPCRASLH
jgi:hypothetical protein